MQQNQVSATCPARLVEIAEVGHGSLTVLRDASFTLCLQSCVQRSCRWTPAEEHTSKPPWQPRAGLIACGVNFLALQLWDVGRHLVARLERVPFCLHAYGHGRETHIDHWRVSGVGAAVVGCPHTRYAAPAGRAGPTRAQLLIDYCHTGHQASLAWSDLRYQLCFGHFKS